MTYTELILHPSNKQRNPQPMLSSFPEVTKPNPVERAMKFRVMRARKFDLKTKLANLFKLPPN